MTAPAPAFPGFPLLHPSKASLYVSSVCSGINPPLPSAQEPAQEPADDLNIANGFVTDAGSDSDNAGSSIFSLFLLFPSLITFWIWGWIWFCLLYASSYPTNGVLLTTGFLLFVLGKKKLDMKYLRLDKGIVFNERFIHVFLFLSLLLFYYFIFIIVSTRSKKK
jgi:hypothetical protein